MKVKNIASNQTEVILNNGNRILVSYETPVAAYVPGEGAYITDTWYSQTTTRHINKWVGSLDRHEIAQADLNAMMGE